MISLVKHLVDTCTKHPTAVVRRAITDTEKLASTSGCLVAQRPIGAETGRVSFSGLTR